MPFSTWRAFLAFSLPLLWSDYLWYSANEHQESGMKQYMTENMTIWQKMKLYKARAPVLRGGLPYVMFSWTCPAGLSSLKCWLAGKGLEIFSWGSCAQDTVCMFLGFRIRHGVCTPRCHCTACLCAVFGNSWAELWENKQPGPLACSQTRRKL